MWYFGGEELQNTPSLRDGIDSKTEIKYRTESVKFIRDIGGKMELGYNTIATAVVYFHRFYIRNSFKEYPRYVTATSCLFLAGKTEETPKRSKDLVKTAQSLLSKEDFQTFGELPREEVMIFEKILLQTINFDLEIEHPYKYLLKYAKYLKGDKVKLQSMIQMAWNFMNDSLRTTLCLQWEPEVIAVALIYLSTKCSRFEVANWKGRKPKHKRWWDLFIQDLDMKILENICNQVLDLYPQSNPSSVFDSPLSNSSQDSVNVETTTSPVVSTPTTPNVQTRLSPVESCSIQSNGFILPGSSRSNIVHIPGHASVDLSVPPPNFKTALSIPSIPSNFNIPPPSIPSQTPFPFYKFPINFSCYPLTPDSSFQNHPTHYPPKS